MRQKEFISLELERQSLSGLLKFPDIFWEIQHRLNGKEYSNKIHQVIYSVIKSTYEENNKLDKVLLAQKIKNLGINFQEDINIFDYCEILYSSTITKDGALNTFKDLIGLRVRFELYETARSVALCVKKGGNKEIPSLISDVDKIFNVQISSYRSLNTEPIDLFNDIEEIIEEIGNNPPDESKFLYGPFETINKIYGSLHRPGNVTILAGRSGHGKTAYSMFYNLYVAEKYNIPILHFDFGEMEPNELRFRACCAFTQGIVPYWAIENGSWRRNDEWVKLVRAVWPRVKKIKIYYQDASKLSPIETISFIRRFANQKIGRGNPFLVNYDYLKPFDVSDFTTPEWKMLGHFIQDIKSFITGELPIPFWANLQLNRKGITTNKKSDQVEDSEESFSISDRIQQQSTHAILLRNKTNDELAYEKNQFGNLKAIWVKHRHLGQEFKRAFHSIKIGKRYVKNYINLNSNSFYFEDRGCAEKMAEKLEDIYEAEEEDKNNDEGQLL